MKKNDSYLKLCNNPYEEGARKVEKKAIVMSIIIAMLIAIITLIVAFLAGK